jgi:hypothetical protein
MQAGFFSCPCFDSCSSVRSGPFACTETTAVDDDDVIIIVVLACDAAVHQMIIAYAVLFDDVPTTREKKLL